MLHWPVGDRDYPDRLHYHFRDSFDTKLSIATEAAFVTATAGPFFTALLALIPALQVVSAAALAALANPSTLSVEALAEALVAVRPLTTAPVAAAAEEAHESAASTSSSSTSSSSSSSA